MTIKVTLLLILLLQLLVLSLTQQRICRSADNNRRRIGSRDYGEELPESRKNFPKSSDAVVFRDDSEPKQCAKLCLNEKYLKHYYAKGCTPVEGEIRYCKRPCYKYFDCPKPKPTNKALFIKPTNKAKTDCRYRGNNYQIGERVPTDNKCRVCTCVEDTTDNSRDARILCASIDCPEGLRGGGLSPSKNGNCYNYYEPDKCCATRQECPSVGEEKLCVYGRKTYRYGERIYPKENPCLVCVCGSLWNQTGNPLENAGVCRPIGCDFEIEPRLGEGCVPVYHESTCCPINYYCPPPKEHHCVFDGQRYAIGERLDFGEPCVECECRVPPDFTCVHRSCPPRPSPDCVPVYAKPEDEPQCCPTYRCDGGKSGLDSVVDMVATQTSKPQVRASLRQQKSPAVKVLATDEPIAEESRPAPLRPCPTDVGDVSACYGGNCTIVNDVFGCRICSCSSCPELKCDGDGCYLYLVTPGACPRCHCSDRE